MNEPKTLITRIYRRALSPVFGKHFEVGDQKADNIRASTLGFWRLRGVPSRSSDQFQNLVHFIMGPRPRHIA